MPLAADARAREGLPPDGRAGWGGMVRDVAASLAFLAVAALGLSGGVAGAFPLVAPSAPSVAAGLAAGAPGACPGALIGTNYTAHLGVEGTPTPPPSVANVSLEASYAYQMKYVPNGGSTTVSCVADTATNATNASGGATLVAGVPASSCDRVSCTYYSGPFAPLAFSTVNGPPPGYFLTSSRQGSSVTLDFVAALSQVSLSPWGRVTVSTDAPTDVRANASAGNGLPSPANLSYAWRVSGTGWSVVAGEGKATVTVEGTTAGQTGTLRLWTNGSYGGGTTDLAETSLLIDPVSTAIASQSVTPTSLDAGGPATFTLTGSGAGGYAYSATVLPGLGMASVTVPCSSTPTLGGTVALSCRALVTYTGPGIAQPSGNLTNRYSTAATGFASVEVAPALVLSLGPDPALAYAGAPVDLTLGVGPSSGTAPFGPACLWRGAGPDATCSTSPGPAWSFGLSFPSAGTYALKGTVEDATGANGTVSGVALVYDRPTLSTISAATNVLDVGGSVVVAATLSGGALPVAYWWNDSLPTGTLESGWSARDGGISADLTFTTPGVHTITLSARDALGTTVANLTTVVVRPGPAVALETPGAGPAPAAIAGSAWTVALCGVDPEGACLPDFSANLSLLPAPGEGTGPDLWANASGRTILPAANGTIDLPSSLWRNGYLNVSVTGLLAAPHAFTVLGPVPFLGGGGGRLAWTVQPDVAHPALGAPHVVRAGSRANATEYGITDRFGNPIDAGFVIVRTVFGGVASDLDSPVRSNASGGFVWVNFSAPAGEGGVVYVLSAWNVSLLPALLVPTGGSASSDLLPLLAVGLGLAALVGMVGALALRRRRDGPAARDSGPGEVAEDELRRIAEGRAHVLRRARDDRRMTLDELAQGFVGPPIPTRAEVAEWVGGLVSEGALKAAPGPDGEPRFVAVERAEPVAPRVEVDPALLEAALGRRPAPDGEDDGASEAPPAD